MVNSGSTDPLTEYGPPLLPEGYRFEGTCGWGGFGFLVRVRDVKTSRECVLKLPHAATLRNPSMLRRFRNEIALHSRLDIPGVAKVVTRCDDGAAPFLGLEHYPLGSLAGWMEMRNSPLPVGEVLRFGHRMAEALGAIHALGIIHRDIRPENLLVRKAAPLEADICDFGMAVCADDTRGLTRLVESDGFLAPEVTGDIRHQATPASDVWSAGMILAYLAWGPGRHLEVLKPRCAPPDGSIESRRLFACIRRCTALWPADRYAGGKALLADLGRVLAGERPTEAESWIHSVSRKQLTRRTILGVGAATGGLLAWRWCPVPGGRKLEKAGTGAWAAARKIVDLVRSGDREEAERLWHLHGGMIAQHPFLDSRVDKALRPALVVLDWHGENLPEIYHATFSKDGSMIAAACQDGTVGAWSWPERRPLFRSESIGHELNMVFFDGTGDFIWSVADDGRARIHDAGRSGAIVGTVQVSPLPLPSACAVGDSLFAGDIQGGIHRVAPKSGTIAWSCRPGSGRVESIAASADGTLLAVGMEDGAVFIMNAGDGKVRGRFRTIPDIRWVDWIHGDILVAGPANKVTRYHGNDYHELWSWPGQTGATRSVVSVNLPGTEPFILATADKGRTAMLDPSSGSPLRVYHGAPELVRHACPSPDGKSIIAVGRHANPTVFNATRGQEFQTWTHRAQPWADAAWGNKNTVAGIDESGTIWKLDGNRIETVGKAIKPSTEARVIAFTPGSCIAWSAGEDLILTSSKGESGARLRTGPVGGLHLDNECCAFAVSGGIAFSTFADGFASLRLVPIDQQRIEAMRIVRDEDHLVVACENTMIILKLPEMVETMRLPRGDKFSPLCATRIGPGLIGLGRRDGCVVVHDWKSGKVAWSASVSGLAVTAVTAGPGVLVTATADGMVRSLGLTTLETGPEWAMPMAQKVSKLEISPDGRGLLAVSSSGMQSMATIWD